MLTHWIEHPNRSIPEYSNYFQNNTAAKDHVKKQKKSETSIEVYDSKNWSAHFCDRFSSYLFSQRQTLLSGVQSCCLRMTILPDRGFDFGFKTLVYIK